mgnify:CR=1 FL=1
MDGDDFVRLDAAGRIDIVLLGTLELIPPSPKRAHQGWRYLTDGDVPTETGDYRGFYAGITQKF